MGPDYWDVEGLPGAGLKNTASELWLKSDKNRISLLELIWFLVRTNLSGRISPLQKFREEEKKRKIWSDYIVLRSWRLFEELTAQS